MTDRPDPTNLSRDAKELTDIVGKLAIAVDQLRPRMAKTERNTVLVAFGLALDLILSIAVAVLISNLFGINGQLQTAIVRESTTREQALCPLYGLLLGSYNPSSRAEGPARDAYNRTFVTLRDGYVSLDCANPIVPPRIDAPPATIPPG